MRIIAIIVVILLIVIFPTDIHGSSAFPEAQAGSYYNFTSLNTGAFPASNAQFQFSEYGNMTDFSTSVEPGIGMNGLTVAAQHFGIWSFFRSDLSSGYGNVNVSLLFSWNNKLSSSFTGNYIVLRNASSTLLNVSFGPSDGFGTYVSSGSSVAKFSSEPAMNKLELISLYVPENSGIAYVRIAGAPLSEAGVPLSFPVPYTGDLGNLSISFGGSYCNMTLYNLSFNHNFPGNLISSTSSMQVTQSTFQSGSAPVQFSNMSGQPMIVREINSVIYAGSGGSVYRFNYYNGSDSILYTNPHSNSTEWISDVSSGDAAYFILSYGTSFTIVSVNTDTLSVNSVLVNHGVPPRFVAQASGENIVLMGYSGLAVSVNISNPSAVSSIQTPEYTGNLSEVNLIWSREYPAYSDAEYYNVLNRTFSEYRIDYLTGVSTTLKGNMLSQYDSGLEVLGYSSVNGTVDSFVEYMPSGTDVLYSPSGYTVAPFLGNSTVMQFSGGTAIIAGNGQYYEIDGNGTGYTTALTEGQGQYLWFGGAFGMIAVNGYVTVFSNAGSKAYSSDFISVSGNSSYFVTGNRSLSFNVSSPLPYSLAVSFDGTVYTVENGNTVRLNVSGYANGEYDLVVTGHNLAGYTSVLNSTLFIDQGVPVMNTTLADHGYVSNTTEVEYSVSWSVGIQSLSISYLNSSLYLPSTGGQLRLATGEYSGPFNVSFILTDRFGKVFQFNYSETAIWNNPRDLSISLWNGEFLNRSLQTIRWSPLSYVRNYSLDLLHGGMWNNVTVPGNQTAVVLENGQYTVVVEAELDNGSSVLIGSATVTIINYAPSIILSHSRDSAYSFYGNSVNSSLYCNITGNVSSTISARLYSPSGVEIEEENGSGFLNFTAGPMQRGLEENGVYTLRIRDAGMSNLANRTDFHFLVNNTIPVNTVLNGTNLYTNTGMAHVGRIPFAYSLLLVSGQFKQSSSIGSTGNLALPEGTGTYSFRLTVYSDSGNTNTSEFEVYYYTSPPELNFSLSSSVLENSPTLYLTTRITDHVPVTMVSIGYQGENSIDETPGLHGHYNITFSRDGNYTVNLTVEDRCSNVNNTSFSVSVVYYPMLKSYSIGSSDYAVIQDLNARLSGYRLDSMNETWYVNGVNSGTGSSLLSSLPFGFDRVTLIITYGNTSVSATKTVFSTGPYVPAVMIAVIAALVVYRNYSGSEDPEKIGRFIADCNGMKVKSILKLSRKAGLRKKSVAENMEKMVEKNSAVYVQDPDGEDYFRIGS